MFWMLGGGEAINETNNSECDICVISDSEKNESKELDNVSNFKCHSLEMVTEVGGRKIFHNTSSIIFGGDANNLHLSPTTSKTLHDKAIEHPDNITERNDLNTVVANSGVETAPSTTATEIGKDVGFYKIEATDVKKEENLLRAAIHEMHRNVNSASLIKLRLLDDVIVNGINIHKNTMVYAKGTLSANRLYLKIESITYNSREYAFNAEIYDNDGLEGLKITESVMDEAGRVTLPEGYRLIIKQIE